MRKKRLSTYAKIYGFIYSSSKQVGYKQIDAVYMSFTILVFPCSTLLRNARFRCAIPQSVHSLIPYWTRARTVHPPLSRTSIWIRSWRPGPWIRSRWVEGWSMVLWKLWDSFVQWKRRFLIVFLLAHSASHWMKQVLLRMFLIPKDLWVRIKPKKMHQYSFSWIAFDVPRFPW